MKKPSPFKRFITLQKCAVCGSPGVEHDNGQCLTTPAHIKSRGAGGPEEKNLIPLCIVCAVEQHKVGWPEFQRRKGINAKELAQTYWDRFHEDSPFF